MSKSKTNKISFNELPIFRSLSLFIKEFVPIMINTKRDIKETISYGLIKDSIKTLKYVYRSYRNTNIKTKLEYMTETLDVLKEIELQMKLLFELNELSSKQISNLSMKIADVIVQLENWTESTKKRLKDKPDENNLNENTQVM